MKSKVKQFRLLKSRKHHRYFIGALATSMAFWMQFVVQGWLVYELTKSAAWVGTVSAIIQGSAVLASPFAGICADRWERRKVQIWVSAGGMIQSLVLAFLLYTEMIWAWHFLVLAILRGTVLSFDMIVRRALITDMFKQEEIQDAFSLNSVSLNLSRCAGPAVGGILLTAIGEVYIFIVNGFVYLLDILNLTRLNTNLNNPSSDDPKNERPKFAETFAYLFGETRLLYFIVLAGVVSFFGTPPLILMPVFTKHVLNGSSEILSWLSSFYGLGALVGALISGRGYDESKLERTIGNHALKLGFSLVLFGFAEDLFFSTLGCFLCGYYFIVMMPAITSMVQLNVNSKFRGRVTGIQTMIFFSTSSLGSLSSSYLASHWNVCDAITVFGCSLMAIALRPMAGKSDYVASKQLKNEAA